MVHGFVVGMPSGSAAACDFDDRSEHGSIQRKDEKAGVFETQLVLGQRLLARPPGVPPMMPLGSVGLAPVDGVPAFRPVRRGLSMARPDLYGAERAAQSAVQPEEVSSSF